MKKKETKIKEQSDPVKEPREISHISTKAYLNEFITEVHEKV